MREFWGEGLFSPSHQNLQLSSTELATSMLYSPGRHSWGLAPLLYLLQARASPQGRSCVPHQTGFPLRVQTVTLPSHWMLPKDRTWASFSDCLGKDRPLVVRLGGRPGRNSFSSPLTVGVGERRGAGHPTVMAAGEKGLCEKAHVEKRTLGNRENLS